MKERAEGQFDKFLLNELDLPGKLSNPLFTLCNALSIDINFYYPVTSARIKTAKVEEGKLHARSNGKVFVSSILN